MQNQNIVHVASGKHSHKEGRLIAFVIFSVHFCGLLFLYMRFGLPLATNYQTLTLVKEAGVRSLGWDCVHYPEESTNGTFQVSLCKGRLAPSNGRPNDSCLDGFVRLQRGSCPDATNFTLNPVLERDIQASYGPDSLYLLLSGPSRYASTGIGSYLGNCAYVLPFHLQLAGRYRLQLLHLRENFNSIQELKDAYPPKLDVTILDEFVSMCPEVEDFDKEVMEALTAVQEMRNENFFPSAGLQLLRSSTEGGSNETLERKQDLKAVLGEMAEQMPYCNASLLARDYGIFLEYYDHKHKGSAYRWMPADCRVRKPSGTSYGREVMEPCMGNSTGLKKVMLLGDSHMRHLTANLYNTLTQTRSLAPAEKYPSIVVKFGHLRLEYKVDRAFEGLNLSSPNRWNRFIDEADMIIFGMGHWPAYYHWSTSRYLNSLKVVMEILAEAAGNRRLYNTHRPLTIIWAGMHPFPDTRDVHTKDKQDWRTLHRLHYWNTQALAMARKLGIKTLMPSFYDVALPLLKTSIDGAHWSGTPSMVMLVQLALHAILPICSS